MNEITYSAFVDRALAAAVAAAAVERLAAVGVTPVSVSNVSPVRILWFSGSWA